LNRQNETQNGNPPASMLCWIFPDCLDLFSPEYVIEPMATTLHALNGERGEPWQYIGHIINGLARNHDGTDNPVMFGYYQSLFTPEVQLNYSYENWISDAYSDYLIYIDQLGREITFGDNNTCP
jgi:hypothetical protein